MEHRGATLGTYLNLATYDNGGNGLRVEGKPGVGIWGIRLIRSFFGSDQLSEIYLDTRGEGHNIAHTKAELSAKRHGVEITENNGQVLIDSVDADHNAESGIWTAGKAVTISTSRLRHNGRHGIAFNGTDGILSVNRTHKNRGGAIWEEPGAVNAKAANLFR